MWACSDIGLVRQDNEDSFYVGSVTYPVPGRLIAVADGMGGHEGGEVASSLAIKLLRGQFALAARRRGKEGWAVSSVNATNDDLALGILAEGFRRANRVIWEQAGSISGTTGMGTTLTAALCSGEALFVAHVGDSRAYLFRDGRLEQLTSDHSLVGELVKANGLSELEAMYHPQRNVLTRALGTEPVVEADLVRTGVRAGDMVLLTTDGLTNLVEREEISAILGKHSPADAARRLVGLANERGGFDNSTVVILRAEQTGGR